TTPTSVSENISSNFWRSVTARPPLRHSPAAAHRRAKGAGRGRDRQQPRRAAATPAGQWSHSPEWPVPTATTRRDRRHSPFHFARTARPFRRELHAGPLPEDVRGAT